MPSACSFCILMAAMILSTAPFSHPASPSPSPSPAPAPAAAAVCDITRIIRSAGQFSSFLLLLLQTGVAQKFQAQANQTQIGITIFAPVDTAFAASPASTLLKNITEQQKVSLCEYHALRKWYSLASLQQTNHNVTGTYATFEGDAGGRGYEFNVTDDNGSIDINTGWSAATIVSTLYNAEACSIFAVDEVLLPEDIFGLPPPPSPPPSGQLPVSPSLQPSSSSSTSSSSSSSSTAAGSSSDAGTRFPLPCVQLLAVSLFVSLPAIFLL